MPSGKAQRLSRSPEIQIPVARVFLFDTLLHKSKESSNSNSVVAILVWY